MKPGSRSTHADTRRVELELCLGQAGVPAGKLVYNKDGAREFSQFAYLDTWLRNPLVFDISPDLDRTTGYQVRKATQTDSAFFLALADTAPDAWGRRVILRAHGKAREKDASLGELTELDYLSGVDDFSRIGALRLRRNGVYLRTGGADTPTTPPLIELDRMLAASRAVENGKETIEDLDYLQGKATSLGGLRPKCTIVDDDGALALGKFPSVLDGRDVTRAEVLTLKLAAMAGIETAAARVVEVQGQPVAVVRRFDRTPSQGRIPYMSAGTLLLANREDEYSYTDLLDRMRGACQDYQADARQLWRRILFNHLVTNTDDHLRNLGFLYTQNNFWRLSPAFDLNPFPDRKRVSKTPLSPDTGPVTSVGQIMGQATRFELQPDAACSVAKEVVSALLQWRHVAVSHGVGLTPAALHDFAPAFEHADMKAAQGL